MLDKFDMSNAKLASTPLANHFKLFVYHCSKIKEEVKFMLKVPYASVVGCLMYVMVCTRLDLTHVVSQVCRFMAKNIGNQ